MGSMIPKRVKVGVGTLTIAGLVAAFALVGGASKAQAQPTQAARLSVDSIELTEADVFTARVGLDPGTSELSAVTAVVSYDTAVLQVAQCEVNGTGACHDGDGELRFAALSVSGFEHSDEFVTIDFERLTEVVATDLELSIEIAVDAIGVDLDEIELIAGQVEWTDADGSMTGAITDAESGEGVYNAEVCASAVNGAPICVTTNGLGNFVVDGLPSGLYTVVVTDPSGVYQSVTLVGSVTSPELTTGMGAELSRFASIDLGPDTENDGDQPAGPQPSSISGHVTDADTGGAIFGLNVCATMPLVLIQSCAYTTSTGSFEIVDLVTGNYELTVTDPAQRFADSAGGVYVGVTSRAGAEAELSVSRH